MTGAVERAPRMIEIDAFEHGGEAVGIAFAPDLAVGDDVESGLLLRPNGEQRGVVLRLGEIRLGNPPQLFRAYAGRKAPGELLAVDQPFGLRVAADKGGGEKHGSGSIRQ